MKVTVQHGHSVAITNIRLCNFSCNGTSRFNVHYITNTGQVQLVTAVLSLRTLPTFSPGSTEAKTLNRYFWKKKSEGQ